MKEHGWADLFSMGPERNFHRVLLGYVNQVFQQISYIALFLCPIPRIFPFSLVERSLILPSRFGSNSSKKLLLIRSSGKNLITYYAATYYQQYIGLGDVTARLLAAANGTEYFLASWVAVYTIEKFGRRSLMLFGAAGMSSSMAILAGMNYMSQLNIGGSAPGVISAVFLFVFNTFFAVGWLGMTCKLYNNTNTPHALTLTETLSQGFTPQKLFHSRFVHQPMACLQVQTGSSISW
jgi:Sugar (and other) transporter